MNRIKNFNQFNESILSGIVGAGAIAGGISILGHSVATSVGQTLGKLDKNAKRLKRKYQDKDGNEIDLAEKILQYLDRMPRTYNPSTDFSKNKITAVPNPPALNDKNEQIPPTFFIFFGKVFVGPTQSSHTEDSGVSKSQKSESLPYDPNTEYRVDVIRASDPDLELHGKPYMIVISVIRQSEKKGPETAIDRAMRARGLSQKELLLTPNPRPDEQRFVLDCSSDISERIYKKCWEIFKATTATTAGRARGGSNTPPPSGDGVFKKWGKKIGRMFR